MNAATRYALCWTALLGLVLVPWSLVILYGMNRAWSSGYVDLETLALGLVPVVLALATTVGLWLRKRLWLWVSRVCTLGLLALVLVVSPELVSPAALIVGVLGTVLTTGLLLLSFSPATRAGFTPRPKT